jgi:hypothetical protein
MNENQQKMIQRRGTDMHAFRVRKPRQNRAACQWTGQQRAADLGYHEWLLTGGALRGEVSLYWPHARAGALVGKTA